MAGNELSLTSFETSCVQFMCIQVIRSCCVIKSLSSEPDLLENRETEDSECKMLQNSEDRNLYHNCQFVIIIMQ